MSRGVLVSSDGSQKILKQGLRNIRSARFVGDD